MTERPTPRCIDCGKTPEELYEYSQEATGSQMKPSDYVWAEEGTLNPDNGHFVCTEDYIKRGMPSAPGGWKAP